MGIKKGISVVLAVILLLTSIPADALAADSGTPKLTALTVQTASGEEVDLLGQWSVKADLGGSYSFTATFDHADQIDSVYITSTKGGAVRMLEAQWDGTAFTTSGWFGGDQDYIPGSIGVEYTVKTETPDLEAPVDWDALETEGCTAEVTSSSPQTTQATIDLAGLLEAEGKVVVDLAVDVFDEVTDGNVNDWLGVYKELELLTKYTLDDGNCILYLDYSDPSTYAMIVHDVSGSKFVKVILNKASDSSQTLRALAEQLGTVSTVSGLANQYFTIQDSADQLRDQVSGRTDLTGTEKEQLNQSIDDYENDRLLFTLTMTVLPAVAASGGTMVVPALIFNTLVGAINAASGYFWDYRVGMISACDTVNADFTPTAHGIPLTRALLQEMNYTITDSGTYYLAEPVNTRDITATGSDVILCRHGYSCTLNNDGGVLEVRDCTYEEDVDGNMVGTPWSAEITNEGGSLVIQSGRVSPLYANGSGHVTINGGTVYRLRSDRGQLTSQIEINDGTVDGILRNSGSLCIRGGRVSDINNDGGTVDILGGLVSYGNSSWTLAAIDNEGGTVTVSGGVIDGNGLRATVKCASDAIENGDDGTLIVTGGTVVGGLESGETATPRAAIKNDGNLVIYGGEFVCGGGDGDAVCVDNEGAAEIYGGLFVGSVTDYTFSGELTIHDGTFQASGANNIYHSWGPLTIEEGTFQTEGGYDNVLISSGKITIGGGTFTSLGGGSCVSSDYKLDLTISGGTFLAPEGPSAIKGNCTLLVGENSDIELSGGSGLFEGGTYTGKFQLTVSTPAGYDGGIVYYDTPEGDGVAVTAAQLMAMDFSREKYLRLVGDVSLCGTSPEGVSVSLSGSGEELRTAKVSDPEQVLDAGVQIWAASYEGGKMTGITSGILKADRTVTFSEPVEAGAVLFFLDGESSPMCGNILLQQGKTT